MALLNYKHLRYFQAVAHDGNLTRAAQRLNVSQSALSVQIRTLEDHLGHALFERRGRRLVMTEAGRIALDHADEIFSHGDALVQTLAQTGQSRKALRVGALATLSRNFQIRFLAPLIGRLDVDVILRSGSAAELIPDLEALALDIVLTNRAPDPGTGGPLLVHPISDVAISLVGTPSRLGKGGDLTTLLATHPLILPSANSSIRLGFDALADRLGVRPQIAAEVDDMAMMRLLAREDAGLAVLPPIVVRDELKSGQLKLAADLPDIRESFHAVTLDRRFPNPLVRELLDAAKTA